MDRAWLLLRRPLALLGCFLLLRIAAAPPQGSATSPHNCAHGNGVYYDETARKCCYRCPAGYKPKTDCPADISSGCTKTRCQPEFYLNRNYVTPHCEACVTCNLKRHLVEKLPCTAASNRVCQCQAGWYCQAPLANTCQRCALHSSCKPGFGVRTKGTAETDTVCQECPPGTFSDEDSNSQPCQNHTDCARLNKLALSSGNATHDRRCTDRAAGGQAAPEMPTGTFLDSKLVRIFGTKESVAKPDNLHISGILGDISKVRPAGFNHSVSVPMDESKRIPRRDNRGFALLAAALLVACSVLLPTVLLLRRRRVCAQWIGPCKLKINHQTKICGKRMDALLSADPEPGEGDPLKAIFLPQAHDNEQCLETEGTPDPERDRGELVRREGGRPLEPTPHSHTSNCIEKIYIMRADTVIVGSVSEAPPGKTCCPAKEEGEKTGVPEDSREEESAMRYPEQETEFHPGSEVTTPVEEEWEFQYSGGKALAI